MSIPQVKKQPKPNDNSEDEDDKKVINPGSGQRAPDPEGGASGEGNSNTGSGQGTTDTEGGAGGKVEAGGKGGTGGKGGAGGKGKINTEKCANYDEEQPSDGCETDLRNSVYSNSCQYCMNTKYPERNKRPFKYCKHCAHLAKCPKCGKTDGHRDVTELTD